MAIDPKYGKVTLEHGTIGEDEPVVVFRARDQLLPRLLGDYIAMCDKAGSPTRHLDLIGQAYTAVVEWQQKNPTKIPDSETSREWLEPKEPVDQKALYMKRHQEWVDATGGEDKDAPIQLAREK